MKRRMISGHQENCWTRENHHKKTIRESLPYKPTYIISHPNIWYLQNDPFYFLVMMLYMCLCCQRSEYYAVRYSCFMNLFPLIQKHWFLVALCCFHYEYSKTNILTMLAKNFNENLLELAYLRAESAVNHNSIEKAEWGGFAG